MVTITISGLHGAGKTTAASKLARKFGLRYMSAGDIFRRMMEESGMNLEDFSRYVEGHSEVDMEIDQRIKEEAARGDVLLDGRLTGWMAENADLRVLMHAPLDVRVRRITRREVGPSEKIKEETIACEGSEARRYKKLYNIDVEDYSIFDLMLNTERLNEKETVQILQRAIESKLK